MNAAQWLLLGIPLSMVAMQVAEWMGTGVRWPAVKNWHSKGLLLTLPQVWINLTLPVVLPQSLAESSVLKGAGWPLAVQILAGYLLFSLANALQHRALHRVDFLWRHVHRFHHRPLRMGMLGVLYVTPQEILCDAVLFYACVHLILGLDATGAAAVALIAAFYGFFQHFNCRTPRWLGWLIQRPESHSLHHTPGGMDCNYADLPLWDVVMGSFSNPREFVSGLGVRTP